MNLHMCKDNVGKSALSSAIYACTWACSPTTWSAFQPISLASRAGNRNHGVLPDPSFWRESEEFRANPAKTEPGKPEERLDMASDGSKSLPCASAS